MIQHNAAITSSLSKLNDNERIYNLFERREMLWGLMLVGGFVAFLIWQANDRIKHPEKWSKIDAEIRSEQAAKKEREYREDMRRVSPSTWMRMTKHQKADVLERRENAAKNRPRKH